MSVKWIVVAILISGCRPAGDKLDKTTENEVVYRSGTKITVEASGEENDYPLVTADPTKICSDLAFYNANGELIQGTRECTSGSESFSNDTSDSDDDADATTYVACSSEGQTNCIASANFPAVAKAGLASKISAGQTLAGVTGTAISAGCTYTTQGDCTANTACRWQSGSCELNPWNIRAGVTVAGTSGALKSNCRNRSNSSLFDSDSMPPGTASTTTGSTLDWWDTIDHFNANAATIPSEFTAAWDSNHSCGKELWSDVTSDGACDSTADDCVMRDNVSGLSWTESYPVTGTAPASTYINWSAAVQHCNDLSYGGFDDWRLPTQLEIYAANEHGISELGYKTGAARPGGDTLDNNDYYINNLSVWGWSATSRSDFPSQAWSIWLIVANTTQTNKTGSGTVLCVRP